MYVFVSLYSSRSSRSSRSSCITGGSIGLG